MDIRFLRISSEAHLHDCLFSLVEKEFEAGHPVILICRGDAECALIDRLLWIHKQESFLPHELLSDGEPIDKRIVIAANMPAFAAQTAILLGDPPPEKLLAYRSVFEIVLKYDEQQLIGKRARFKIWKDLGHEPGFEDYLGNV